jgi:hypothetical protein
MNASFVCQIVNNFVVILVFPPNFKRYMSLAEQDDFNSVGCRFGTAGHQDERRERSVAHVCKLEILDRVQ